MSDQAIAHPPNSGASVNGRRIDLDWVRIGAFGLLILYHVGMLYVPWDFHIKSSHRIPALEAPMLLLNPWRLALLFLVAGVATRFMLGKYALLPLMRARTSRLLLPLAFGMVVIVPPQSYVQIVESLGCPDGFWDFCRRHYFSFGAQFCPNPCIVLPTWNHLWFVAYLWIYTMALGALLLALPAIPALAERWLAPPLSGARLLLLPALVFAAYRLILLPVFPSTHALSGDWYNHAQYATAFLLGFVLAHHTPFWDAILRQRWIALSLSAGLCGSFLAAHWIREAGAPPPWLKLYAGAAYGFYQWCCMVAVLGFARRWITVDSAARRYLADAIFPYYILHQTAIILIAHALRGQGLPAGLEASTVVFGTVAVCALGYEIVRRIRLLRPLFGLRWAAPEKVLRPAHARPSEA